MEEFSYTTADCTKKYICRKIYVRQEYAGSFGKLSKSGHFLYRLLVNLYIYELKIDDSWDFS